MKNCWCFKDECDCIITSNYDDKGFRYGSIPIHMYGTLYGNDGYDIRGFNNKRIHMNGTLFDNDGYDFFGLNKDNFCKNGFYFRQEGQLYNDEGFDKDGWKVSSDKEDIPIHKNGTIYGDDGYSYMGYNKDGYDNQGNYYGIKYDEDGYDIEGFNNKGIHRNGTEYNDEGYDINEIDRYGYTREGECNYCCNKSCTCSPLY